MICFTWKKGQMPCNGNSKRLGNHIQEKVAHGAINFAAWTAPMRLPLLMEMTLLIIIRWRKIVLAAYRMWLQTPG